MQTNDSLLSLRKESIEFSKALTIRLNNGGAVTFQIDDVLEFIYAKKFANEIEFLSHLLQTNSLTQDSLECFLKHMLYSKETARLFTQWQREYNSSNQFS
jgi:hypothetical protein